MADPSSKNGTVYNPNYPHHHPVSKTNVPGKVAVLAPHGKADGQVFERRTGGDTLPTSTMAREELELRRSGQVPSKEFIAEKKRRAK